MMTTETSQPEANPRPVFAFDMDGVICRPPLGINFTISRRLNVRPLPESVKERARLDELHRSRRWLEVALERMRFAGRRPMPDAADGLAAVSAVARPVLVTGRSFHGGAQIDRWLRRFGLRDYFSELYPNSTRLGNAQFKLWLERSRGIAYHVDDDPSTANYLARNGLTLVFMRDWPRNRGLNLPPNVVVIHRLDEIARHLPEL